MEKLKAFIIYLPNREHSVSHATYMKDFLEQGGNFEPVLFEGTNGSGVDKIFEKEERKIYPYGIKSRDLNREEIKYWLKDNLPLDFWETYTIKINERSKLSEKEIDKISRKGVKGCFHSHYRLWKKCVELQEPIAIFEDDVKFYRNYIPVPFEGVLILSLGKSSFLADPGKTYLERPSGTPAALPWKNFSMPGASGYAITPDAAQGLIKFYRPYWYPADNAINQFTCKIQIHNYIMGRNTLPEEGNISMTKAKDWL